MHRRAIARTVSHRLDEAAVVRVSGPRAAGKTTTCVAEIDRRNGTVVRLDDPVERSAVAADPTGYLAGLAHPVLIDEYQRVPTTLDVIKVDLSRRAAEPGRWLLCGSISVDAVTGAAESLGGRLTDVEMGTLTVDERNDRPEPAFLARLLVDGLGFLSGWRPVEALTRDDLLAEAIRGGFPLVTDRAQAASRRRGLDDWVNASVIADGAAVGGFRNPEDLRRMLSLYAGSTASVTPKDTAVGDRLDVDRRTAAGYRSLLSDLYVTWQLPSFVPGNATGQVLRSSKLHLVDTGLAAALAGRDLPASLRRDPAYTGALVETMVANDLRVQASVLQTPPRLYHYREDQLEVDLVVESADGRVHGIEIKLGSNPGSQDLNGLRRLRRSSGDRWAAGVLLCRVPVGRLDEQDLAIAPVDAVWHVTG